jgi:hypothetical protein
VIHVVSVDIVLRTHPLIRYFNGFLSLFEDVSDTLAFVSGILRLSTKYYVQRLRQQCIDILGRKIPTSFLTFRSRRYSEFSADICFSIINLARETNVPEWLPFMFYLCARLPTNLVLNGTAAAVLSWKDRAICLAGRAKLLHAQRTISYAPFIDIKHSASCENHPTLCASRILETNWINWERQIFVEIFALESHTPISMKHHVCPPCVEYAMLQHREGCEKVWDILPGMFQLGSWEDIWNRQNDDISIMLTSIFSPS